ncbi:MAG TPA: hypothetical protein VFN35_08475, partial [Ktedonobacteraceae bacterium]|nr:hypothetical protein [Ktedonobacteraceae bacterium]
APRFPPGQGNAPLLGIEQKQAKAFVTWLTKREQGPWQYRLPKAGELNEQEIAEMLPTGTGFWLEEDQGFCWVKQVPILPVESLNKILGVVFPGKSRLDLQLNRVQKIIQSATRARRELKKSETVAAGPRDEANRWARILSRVEEEGKELISELKNALPSASSPNLPHARAIVLAFALAFCPEHKTQDDSYRQASSLIEKHVPKPIRARELSFRLGPYLAQSLVERLKQKERAQLMEEMLDMYLNLAILEGRIRDLFPTCEGIFLVKEQKHL